MEVNNEVELSAENRNGTFLKAYKKIAMNSQGRLAAQGEFFFYFKSLVFDFY